MKNITIILVSLILSFLPFTVDAAVQPSQHTLNVLENYLNNIHTLEADFEQIDTNGKLAHGKFYLSRPGKLRLDYKDSNSLLIIADGQFLIHHDLGNNEVTTMAISETPAEFILRERINFHAGIKIKAFEETENYYKLTLIKTEDNEGGSLTFKFWKKPLTLAQWSVIDAQAFETTVNLRNLKMNLSLNHSLFVFNRSRAE